MSTPEHFYLGTFQTDPGTKDIWRCTRLFCSHVGLKLQSAPESVCNVLFIIAINLIKTFIRLIGSFNLRI